MKNSEAALAVTAILVVIVGITLGYLIWVGIFWLINTVFGLTLHIWWGGLFGIIAANLLKSIFKRGK
jgi:hypothetical protein